VLSGLWSALSSPLTVLGIVGAVLVILLVVVAVAYLAQRLKLPSTVKSLSSWLTSPGVDALVFAVDPITSEARIVPARRVGLVYASTEVEPLIVIPIRGGEVFNLRDFNKPVVYAIRHGRFGVQWAPAQEQILSLALEPVSSGGAETSDPEEVERRLVSEIMNGVAELTGEIVLSPEIKLYVSVKPGLALSAFKSLVAYGSSTSLLAVQSTSHALAEEGARLLELQARIRERTTMTLAAAIMIIAISIAVSLAILAAMGVIKF